MNNEHVKILLSGAKHWSQWRLDNPGTRPDLSGANLREADLSGANLTRANLSGADLSDADLFKADLTRANLSDADLFKADLTRANLSGANLTRANLSDADLRGVVGNGREVKTIQTTIWVVTYTAEVMQIGCQRHPIDTWWAFTDDEISRMDRRALGWWRTWKPVLRQIIEVSPAVPTRHETTTEVSK